VSTHDRTPADSQIRRDDQGTLIEQGRGLSPSAHDRSSAAPQLRMSNPLLKRVNRGYQLREDHRPLYEVMEEAFLQFLQSRAVDKT
jgi:hypothetical protein